mmetsp:Transcript_73000/g.237347  ORF Transcript_73000/g.237347 Transcript_73000/m.237347 type:complete len:202 (-) Transcript_73000:204-809(-)
MFTCVACCNETVENNVDPFVTTMPVLGLDEMDDGEDENSKEEPARVEEPPKIEESKQVQETIQVLVKDVPEPVAEPETKAEVVVVEKKEDGHQKTEKIEAPVAPPEPEREAATASPKEEFAPSDSQRSAGSGLGWKVSDKLQQWEERMSKPKDGVVTLKADGAVRAAGPTQCTDGAGWRINDKLASWERKLTLSRHDSQEH